MSPGGLVRKGYEKIILKTLNTKSAFRSTETTHELQSWLSLVVICSISNSARRLLQNYCLPNLFSCQKSSAVAVATATHPGARWRCDHSATCSRISFRFARRLNLEQVCIDAFKRFGGADRDRTDDILLAKQALSQLSYSPTLAPFYMSRRSGGPG